jgi:hypothetical protein
MVPDIDLQLQAVIKALTDTVMPAIDPANKMAVEQAGLAVATLAMARSRLPLVRRLVRHGLDMAIATAEELLAAVPAAATGLAAPLDAARQALLDPARDTADIDTTLRALNDAIGALVDASSSDPDIAVIEAIILRRGKLVTDLGRAWTMPAGFEPNPASVPTIESLLS